MRVDRSRRRGRRLSSARDEVLISGVFRTPAEPIIAGLILSATLTRTAARPRIRNVPRAGPKSVHFAFSLPRTPDRVPAPLFLFIIFRLYLNIGLPSVIYNGRQSSRFLRRDRHVIVCARPVRSDGLLGSSGFFSLFFFTVYIGRRRDERTARYAVTR